MSCNKIIERPQILRVAVASPGDVEAERDIVPIVVDEVNRWIGSLLGLRLEVGRWETDTRVMNRLKALYRSWAIPCAGTTVYAPRHRAEWLGKITEAGVRRRAEIFYRQLDTLQTLRQEVRRVLLAESRKQSAAKLLRQIPGLGPIRVALLIALIQTPYRFRAKRQLWAYSGLGLETHGSAQYRYQEGRLQRSKNSVVLRGLNKNHNHDKNVSDSTRAQDSPLPKRSRDNFL